MIDVAIKIEFSIRRRFFVFNTYVILPVILYGVKFDREEQRLRVLQKGLLRRIFKPKRDKMVGGRRKLHIIDLHSLCSLPTQR
jgi:hypothetical protein